MKEVVGRLGEASRKQFTQLAKPFVDKFEQELRMDKIVDEAALLKRVEQAIAEIIEATGGLQHSGKEV